MTRGAKAKSLTLASEGLTALLLGGRLYKSIRANLWTRDILCNIPMQPPLPDVYKKLYSTSRALLENTSPLVPRSFRDPRLSSHLYKAKLIHHYTSQHWPIDSCLIRLLRLLLCLFLYIYIVHTLYICT